MRSNMIKALRDSIEHWYGIQMMALSGELMTYDYNGGSCPCCRTNEQLCADNNSFDKCSSCIISITSENYSRAQCWGTPWYVVRDRHMNNNRRGMLRAIEEEIHFLEWCLEIYLNNQY